MRLLFRHIVKVNQVGCASRSCHVDYLINTLVYCQSYLGRRYNKSSGRATIHDCLHQVSCDLSKRTIRKRQEVEAFDESTSHAALYFHSIFSPPVSPFSFASTTEALQKSQSSSSSTLSTTQCTPLLPSPPPSHQEQQEQ